MSRITLIAITVAILAEVLRVAFPQFGHYSQAHGAGTAIIAVPLVCLAGFLAPLIRSAAGGRAVVLIGIGGLLAARLAMQVLSPGLWLALAGTALGVLAVTALYEVARGMSGTGLAVATMAGLTGDTALQLAFGTWDPVARSSLVASLVGVVIVAVGSVALVLHLRSTPAIAPRIGWADALGAAALGPFFALQVLVLGSPAFTASNGWMSLPAAGATILVGQAIAMAFLASGLAVQAVPGGVCVFGGTVLGVGVAAVTGTYGLAGHLTSIVIILGQVLAAWLFAVACRAPLRTGRFRRASAPAAAEDAGAVSAGSDAASADAGSGGGRRRSHARAPGMAWRVDLGAALGGFLAPAILLAYQLHYEHPLPVANKVLPGVAGILLGALSAMAAARGGPLPYRSWLRALGAGVAALVLLVVPLLAAVTAPATAGSVQSSAGSAPAGAQAGTFKLVSYDIDDAMNAAGRVDLEAIARTIESQHPDVVALQDVSRGWTVAGSADEGEWLSRRLKMKLVWGPAADGQSGNAVLTRLPIRASGHGRLPLGAGPRVDGYVWARLDVGNGQTTDVWSIRLESGADRVVTRLGEVTRLIQAWSGAPHTIMVGDVNAAPGSPEINRLTGQTGLSAPPDGAPVTTATGRRVDTMIGTDDLGLTGYGVVGSVDTAHYPVVASVRVIG